MESWERRNLKDHRRQGHCPPDIFQEEQGCVLAVLLSLGSWEGWRPSLLCCQLSCCAEQVHVLSPLLCTLTSASLALHSFQRFPERWDSASRPCSPGSLKRLIPCPPDTCNTGAHVFKKPGPGDIPMACCWLSFPALTALPGRAVNLAGAALFPDQPCLTFPLPIV